MVTHAPPAAASCLPLVALIASGCLGPAALTPTPDAGARVDAPAARDPFDAGGYEPAELELGTGLTGFEPVAENARIELVHGPQGGYHILARYRFSAFLPDVYVYFRVSPLEGESFMREAYVRVHRTEVQGLRRTAVGWESAYAELVVLTAVGLPTEVVGRRCRWDVVVEEVTTGRLAAAHREVVLVDELP